MDQSELDAAAREVRRRDDRMAETAVVLGSGLGALVETAEEQAVIPTRSLPGYPMSTVEGHEGRLVFGRVDGRMVAFLQGRVHRYEGYSIDNVTAPVRLLARLGVRHLILTNAAGGINPNFVPGSLMFIEDHITLGTLEMSAVGGVQEMRRRPVNVYDGEWRDHAAQIALDMHIQSETGVYAWTPGPNYETPAEVRAFALAGADAVGMSTVPEALQARNLGMNVLAVSMITNRAAGLHSGPLTHEEVLDTAARVRIRLSHLIRRIIGLEGAT